MADSVFPDQTAPKAAVSALIAHTCPFHFLELLQSSREEGGLDCNFSNFSSKPYVVNPHLNPVLLRGIG